nr:YdcF family protein [Dysosmobacter acutus]
MRFSGFLLIGTAAAIGLSALIDARAEKGRLWRWLRRAFYGALSVLIVLLTSIEVFVISKGREDFTALPSEAVIVLGAGVNGREPSLALKSRLDAALAYLEEHPDIPVVLTGGKGYGEEITEAQCMYEYLTGHGVEGERLITEEQALNTAENFAFSRALLSEHGVDVENGLVAVVTNDFHVARSRLIAQRQGVRMLGVPAPLPWKHLSANYYLRESFAMVKTFLFD